jgi:hypothetical protein
VHDNRDEDGHEFSDLLLKSDGQTLKQRVESQGHYQQDGAEGRVVEDVCAVTVSVVLVLKINGKAFKNRVSRIIKYAKKLIEVTSQRKFKKLQFIQWKN